MALETVVFQPDPFSYGCKDFVPLGSVAGYGPYGFGFEEEKVHSETLDKNMEQGSKGYWDSPPSSMVQSGKDWETNSMSPEMCTGDGIFTRGYTPAAAAVPTSSPRKRRRTQSLKNKEDMENQRMTHIAVERNRRKQMNDYLGLLRSLMPPSYAQRWDQASIIGGAINCVKDLEQLLQFLEANKQVNQPSHIGSFPLFANFFTFPQYSTRSTRHNDSAFAHERMAEKQSAIADVEVNMVESHANIKVLSKRRPKQLLTMVAGLLSLRLTILHLNVTTVDHMVLRSFSVKVEDDCQLSTVDEIATAVHEMVAKIQEEAMSS
ncbi:hypothetical protein F0562_005573 [Nyssa sinensis]|uniref:BHLH domain-containing protein n=1 Tax=Nyssa sinensis TaxID=561372 RepID=A0A5J5AIE7_9ASTE|nr:hypothetical protein F0562_005573 [Nyssa sinensis]